VLQNPKGEGFEKEKNESEASAKAEAAARPDKPPNPFFKNRFRELF